MVLLKLRVSRAPRVGKLWLQPNRIVVSAY